MQALLDFLELLEANKIYYRLNKIRDSILVEIAVPGQRWEVEYFADGSIRVEKFISEGIIRDASALTDLIEEFSDV